MSEIHPLFHLLKVALDISANAPIPVTESYIRKNYEILLDTIIKNCNDFDIVKSRRSQKLISGLMNCDPTNADFAPLNEAKAKMMSTQYAKLCVSPPKKYWKTDLNIFIQKCADLLKRSMIPRGCYVLEQRGTDVSNNIGDGVHAHFLLQRDLKYPPKKWCDCIRSTFKKIVNISDEHFFYLKFIPDHALQDQMVYFSSNGKKGPGKDKKQAGDTIWRKYNILEKIYLKNWQLNIPEAVPVENSSLE